MLSKATFAHTWASEVRAVSASGHLCTLENFGAEFETVLHDHDVFPFGIFLTCAVRQNETARIFMACTEHKWNSFRILILLCYRLQRSPESRVLQYHQYTQTLWLLSLSCLEIFCVTSSPWQTPLEVQCTCTSPESPLARMLAPINIRGGTNIATISSKSE